MFAVKTCQGPRKLIASTTPESLLDQRAALVGTPAEAVELIRYHRTLFGEHEPSLQINFGGMSEPDATRTLERLAAHVMPAFPEPTGQAD